MYNEFYVCSNTCEIHLMPYNKINNTELLDETLCTIQAPVEIVSNTNLPLNPSFESQVNRNTITNNDVDVPNTVDTFSHVYCDYINYRGPQGFICSSW